MGGPVFLLVIHIEFVYVTLGKNCHHSELEKPQLGPEDLDDIRPEAAQGMNAFVVNYEEKIGPQHRRG